VAKIGVTETSGKITMSKPPFVVNKATSVSGRYLFVNSNLVAKNEPPEIVKDRSIVDVYDLSNGAYRYSFYVFDYMHSRMESFKVKDSILIATFRNHVVRYDLPSAHRR
jgi:hypothetical protein